MTTVSLELTNEQAKWCEDWATLAGHANPTEGIIEMLKLCGGLPRGSEYYQKKFAHLK